MKKKFRLIVGILAIYVVILTSSAASCISHSWAGTMIVSNMNDSGWEITAQTLNGNCSGDIEVGTALQAECSNGAGTVTLTVTQGDIVKTFDLTGEFNDDIDLSEFGTGTVNLRVDFNNVEDLDISLSW